MSEIVTPQMRAEMHEVCRNTVGLLLAFDTGDSLAVRTFIADMRGRPGPYLSVAHTLLMQAVQELALAAGETRESVLRRFALAVANDA